MEAQKWFDLGLNWCFAFNQEEALGCFRRMLELDPRCVIAHWGIAYSAGPFYNLPWRDFGDEEAAQCTELCHGHIAKAQSLAANASPVENALVDALAARFQEPHRVAPEEFDRWDDAYGDAMRSVHARFPDDVDVAALLVEALITRTPWKLWDVKTGLPADGADTIETLDLCEQAIARAAEQGVAQHPAMLHLHIHILEMSNEPERAKTSADDLRNLCPDAGHMNHMPAHIDVLVGDYDKARIASEKAIVADDKYVDYAGSFNFYTTSRCHDLHMMMYTCMFLGRYQDAIRAADQIRKTLTPEVLRVEGHPQLAMTVEGYYATRMHVLVRFGEWQEIVDTPLPDYPDLYCVSTAMHHYARVVAHAALKNFAAAEQERRLFGAALKRIPSNRKFFNNSAASVLAVGEKMLEGELAYHKGDYVEAFEHLRESVRRDDNLYYTEPWAWMHPPRHALAALLMEQGHDEEAEAVYRADLGMDGTLQRCGQHPNNVWSLHGLVECLERRGETDELSELQPLLLAAIAKADVAITSSCMCRTETSSPSSCSD